MGDGEGLGGECWDRIGDLFNAAARAGMSGDHELVAALAEKLAGRSPRARDGGPGAAKYAVTRAAALHRAGRDGDALEAAAAALEAGGDDYEAWRARGQILEARGDSAGALEAYGKAAGCAGKEAEGLSAVMARTAMLLNSAGRHEEAARAAEGALRADPGAKAARAALAMALGSMGRHEEALKAAEGAPGGGMDDAKVMPHIAMGNMEAALECAGRAAREMPADAAMWHIKARLLAGLGRDEEALDALTVAAAISPMHARMAAGDKGFERMRGGERFRRIAG